MKKSLFLGIILVVLLLFTTTHSQAITIGFDPVSQVVQVGSTADVELVISGLGDYTAPSLSLFDMDIAFDPGILAFSSATFGPYLGDPDPLAFETSVGLTDYGTGTVNIWEVSWLDANPTSGPSFMPPYLEDMQPESFTLATLTFDTLAVGTSSLDITTIWALGDAWGDPLTADLESGSISPVPEPATVLLFGAGLVGLLGLGRKKFFKRS